MVPSLSSEPSRPTEGLSASRALKMPPKNFQEPHVRPTLPFQRSGRPVLPLKLSSGRLQRHRSAIRQDHIRNDVAVRSMAGSVVLNDCTLSW